MMSLFPQLHSESSHHESDQPSATPAEAGVHGSSVSLSEAFLHSSSRTRDTLPEQYQSIFDELRSGILAFCKEFAIPVETLRSKEDFGKQLASKKISPERMAEAVLLFQQLEHLVTHGEPLKETLPEYLQKTERLYNLTEQYTAQVKLLERIGILKGGVIKGIDGHQYPIPTLEQIAKRLYEREKELSIKRDQGFTKLLLVPFGMSLDDFYETLEQFLLSYKQKHSDFDLNISNPFKVWSWYKGADLGDPPDLVYNPKFFRKDHQGKTKLQILEEQTVAQDSFPGWKVHLFQPSDPSDQESKGFAPAPRQDQGKIQGEENPRPDLETNKTPIEYLSILQKAQDDPTSPYFQESGLTPEDWILAFITHLEETRQPLDDYRNDKEESIICLAGVFSPSSFCVFFAHWYRDHRQVSMSEDFPGNRGGSSGVRTSVMV